MAARYWFAGALLLALVDTTATAGAEQCRHVLVETEDMREVMAAIKGYDIAATTNQLRFVADFLFALAQRPQLTERSGTFQVQPERFFQAWLDVTGQRFDQAPVSMRLVLEHGQRFVVEVDPPVRIVPGTRVARQVLSVRASWPNTSDAEDHYSYHDTLAEPSVRLRHERDITYQLIDFGDFTAFENMRGIHGQPTSGGLGALFNLLGMAEIRQSRFAVAGDQTQVNRSKVKKLFYFTAQTTITPQGIAERGIPPGRDDLRALAERLETTLHVEAREPPPHACDP
ncbi:MAG: hypothetical protein LC637_00355 [Xanthomonadaceae bacterium]|nr:hypothetical protein [Xanthomonadaceae bacterium]